MSIGAFHLAAKESFIIRKPRSSEFQRESKNKLSAGVPSTMENLLQKSHKFRNRRNL
ncbi:hypothetical protein LEP1GSC059_1405 [Leptospira noguchii serovar Panama str. CZ214]|uniref:Uncharacterized protein n=1 Tax=Leptospira noguchii serovar Panama str. CZ214 TaxID=1001595 RepID=T0FBA2_9LEPT|nr:hypothetical protein LEP1GSC059_1405 [Leptospira noguchii serovar Panama str. CZ214]